MIKDEAVGVLGQDLQVTAGKIGMKTEDTVPAPPPSGGGNPNGEFEAMEEGHDQDLWLGGEQETLIDVNDTSIFYDDFPPLPDFPCMSSSSSSSSAPAPPLHPAATSSSSNASSSSPATSWAMMKSSDAEEETGRMRNINSVIPHHQMQAGPTTMSSSTSMEAAPLLDCIDDGMENFCYMDMLDSNEIWDPSSVFQTENLSDGYLKDNVEEYEQQNHVVEEENENYDGFSFIQKDSELAIIFFEWLKQNKDYISAEEMRSIKLKRSTIETASNRLGTTKEGKKQLLKLILEWVEQYQLQKKKTIKQSQTQNQIANYPSAYDREPLQNPNPNPNFNNKINPIPPDPNACFPPTSHWMASPAPPPDMVGPAAFYRNVDPYYNPMLVPPMNQVVNGIPYLNPTDYPVMDSQPWAQPAFPILPPPQFSPYPESVNISPHHQQGFLGHPYQILDRNGEGSVRLGASATKEARKKRMARQRRLYSHHRRNSSPNQHQGVVVDHNTTQVGFDGGEIGDGPNSPGSWAYWSPPGENSSPPSHAGVAIDASQSQSVDRTGRQPFSADRRQQQSWKAEKNLKFLLQKVLKQSDVGNLGRIVLPKKEAESHLPELESRDGMPIAMEDIGTSRVWNMRYRFWPNNKSRMYLLENTGDFVRANGLQEGDFIVIYSDTKCGKYMIRGVKVRQPGGKLENKMMSSRRNSRSLSFAGNNRSSLAPIKQAKR